MKRFLAILLTAVLLLTCAAAETDSSQKQYVQAWHLVLNGEYRQAGTAFEKLGDYEDSELLAYLLGVSAYAESMTLIGDGVLAYEFHDQWGVINLNTHTLTQPTWDSVGKLDANGLAKVRQYGQYGYINAQGETVIACEWDDISNFLYGLCTVKKNRLFGMMNAAGELVTPAEWRMLGSSQSDLYAPVFTADGRMVVQNQNRKYGLMDKSGSILGEVCWDNAPDLTQELPLVLANNRYGFIDHDGNVVIEPQYRKAMPFSEGLAAVSVDGMMMQFIDRENNVIVPPVYVDVQSFSGGVAHVKQPGMSWQVIDKTGQLVYFVTDQIRADYAAAVEMMAAEDYAGAVKLLSGTIGYKDSYERLNEARTLVPLKAAYDEGSAYLAKEEYEEAIAAFDRASGYKDAEEQKINVKESVYLKATGLLAEEEYYEAMQLFEIILDYKDSHEKMLFADSQILAIVEFVNSGEYGFELNDEGYYESTNQQIPDSYAMCEIKFKANSGVIYLDCINYADQLKDFALISVLDKSLSKSNSADTENVHTSFKYKNSTVVQTIRITVPDTEQHTICIKYRKDGSGNAGNDSFQFRVRFE